MSLLVACCALLAVFVVGSWLVTAFALLTRLIATLMLAVAVRTLLVAPLLAVVVVWTLLVAALLILARLVTALTGWVAALLFALGFRTVLIVG